MADLKEEPTVDNTDSNPVEETVETEIGESPFHIEGKQNAQWILMDYISVVVHIFLKDKRQFYALEELWGDAKIKQIADQ